MKIVVINTAASSGGALSILTDFYKYIKENDKNHEWVFILSDNYIEDTKNIKVIVKKDVKSNWANRLSWDIANGGKFINKLRGDIVISMQNTMPRGIIGRKIIYLHQPIPFQNTKRFSFFKEEERFLAIYQYLIGYLIKKSLNRVDKIIVQTDWMKKSVEQLVNISSEKIAVIKPNIDIDLDNGNMKIVEFDNSYFFYPASGVIYKNHRCIIDAVKILKMKGIKNFKVEFTLEKEYYEKLKIDEELKDIIILSGNLPRNEVFKRYKSSTLVFPSYIETFGLPLLEASKLGTIILASECEFSKEILDEYINKYYFNPFDPNQLAKLMEKVLKNEIILNLNYSNNHNDELNGWKNFVNEIDCLTRG